MASPVEMIVRQPVSETAAPSPPRQRKPRRPIESASGDETSEGSTPKSSEPSAVTHRPAGIARRMPSARRTHGTNGVASTVASG